MNKLYYLMISGLVLIFANSGELKSQRMNENQQNIAEAKAKMKAFEEEKEPERLREAYLTMQNVDIFEEPKEKMRKLLRGECLIVWLRMLNQLDENLDKDFNPDEEIELQVQPPPTKDGTVFPPGVDPDRIDDPKARAEYEEKIRENREKLVNYRMQTYLGRIRDDISQGAKTFILTSYTSDAHDRLELKSAIEKIVEDPARKEELMGLVKEDEE